MPVVKNLIPDLDPFLCANMPPFKPWLENHNARPAWNEAVALRTRKKSSHGLYGMRDVRVLHDILPQLWWERDRLPLDSHSADAYPLIHRFHATRRRGASDELERPCQAVSLATRFMNCAKTCQGV